MVARSWQIWLLAGIPCSFAFGFACTALVIYNSEIAPLQIRGFLLSTWALGYALGQTMGGVALQILATVSTKANERTSWPLVLVSQPIPPRHLLGVGLDRTLLGLPSHSARNTVALRSQGSP